MEYEFYEDFFLGVIYYNVGYKHPKIIFEGVDYRIDFKAAGRTSWRCSYYYRTKCRAKLSTSGHVVRLFGEHNHQHRPDLYQIDTAKPQRVTVIRENRVNRLRWVQPPAEVMPNPENIISCIDPASLDPTAF